MIAILLQSAARLGICTGLGRGSVGRLSSPVTTLAMETSVPLPLVGTAEPAPNSGALAAAPRDPAAAKPSARRKVGELAVVAGFSSELPITEAERQLVSAYLAT